MSNKPSDEVTVCVTSSSLTTTTVDPADAVTGEKAKSAMTSRPSLGSGGTEEAYSDGCSEPSADGDPGRARATAVVVAATRQITRVGVTRRIVRAPGSRRR